MTASDQAAYCVHCGQPSPGGGSHEACANPRTALEPPRFCTYCARRMIVQIDPFGWTARCSRHGDTTGG